MTIIKALFTTIMLGIGLTVPQSTSQPEPIHILTIGDSITAAGKWQAETGRLLDIAGVPHQINVAAVNGTKCLYWTDKIANLLTQYQPDVVFIFCGTNDDPTEYVYGEPATGWSMRYMIETAYFYRPSPPKIFPGLIQYSDPILAPSWLLTNEPQTNDIIYRNVVGYESSRITSFVDFQGIPATATYLAQEPYAYPPYYIAIHPTDRGYKYMGRIVYDAGVGIWPATTEPALCDLYGHRNGYPRPAYTPC